MAQVSSASRQSSSPTQRKNVVAFDSSFLIAVMQHPTPWMEDIADKVGAFIPILLTSVRDELESLAARGDKTGRFAALALGLMQAGKFSLIQDGGGKPDDEIISFALREGAAVATIDSDLAERLRASKVGAVVTLRGGRVST